MLTKPKFVSISLELQMYIQPLIQHLYWMPIKLLKFNVSKWNSQYFLYLKHVLPSVFISVNGNFILLDFQVKNVSVTLD